MIAKDFGISIGGRGWDIDCAYSHRFDRKAPKPSRAVWTLGWQTRKRGLSVMFQLYRPGMGLDWHVDGYRIHNYVWSFVLWQPKVGGALEVDGPHKTWWRFHYFDGGVSHHRVTTCGGHRAVLIFQRMKAESQS